MNFTTILFLDFDGVLHPVGGVPMKRRLARLPLLEALLREPALREVGIVISSTWRIAYTMAQLRSSFAPDMRDRIVDRTPQLDTSLPQHARHAEISAWLARHPDVSHWVAVDDDVRGFPPGAHGNTVFTCADTGLTGRDIEVLRTRLTQSLAAGSAGTA
jgi:hypothetical protein